MYFNLHTRKCMQAGKYSELTGNRTLVAVRQADAVIGVPMFITVVSYLLFPLIGYVNS